MARPVQLLSQEQRQLQIMAPQLRQSLELLQAPLLELRALVQRELQVNPALEEKPAPTQALEPEEPGAGVDDAKELAFKEEFEILARIDEESCRYFMQDLAADQPNPDRDKALAYRIDSQVKPESLQDHLSAQLRVSGLSGQDLEIGELIVGSVNADGYLRTGVEELAAASGFDPARIQDVLAVVQDFDPVGVAAANVRECLLSQLERLGRGESLAAALVQEHLADVLKATPEQVQQAAKLIATLEPKPGRAFGIDQPAYIMPDVIVEKAATGYVVRVINDYVPRLAISRRYRDMARDAATDADAKAYLRERIRSGLFLIKSLTQRQHTLHRVAAEIVEAQSAFLDEGVAQLKPLTMAEVADKIGLHETTVWRCAANKYMKTPRGMFEIKYFFTPGFQAADGSRVSNKTVQERLAAMVAAEDPAHPLSDQELMDRFRREGLPVARRTLTKYRLALKIPPSHLRKQM